MSDEYDLQRFIRAQDPVYQDAIDILRRGMMCTPYMDFIFPRLAIRRNGGIAEPYAITSLDEASAFLSLPILGGRYRECIGILQRLSGSNARAGYDEVDAKKLHASLTLFSEASNDEFLLETMFDVWFNGLLDEDTMMEIRSI
ncbi:DUF1810 family protein [Phyllobacteriaceae bacterium JZ32]